MICGSAGTDRFLLYVVKEGETILPSLAFELADMSAVQAEETQGEKSPRHLHHACTGFLTTIIADDGAGLMDRAGGIYSGCEAGIASTAVVHITYIYASRLIYV